MSLALIGVGMHAGGPREVDSISARQLDDPATVVAELNEAPVDGFDAPVKAPKVQTLLYGIYPGGGTGETPNAPRYSPDTFLPRIQLLRGSKPFSLHLYTAWSWHDPTWFDPELAKYLQAGLSVTITIKYSPPSGHNGDVAGYTAFVRDLARKYGRFAGVTRLVIGNEANVSGNPDASDGYFARAAEAIVSGAIAAQAELTAIGSPTRVSVNFATTSRAADTAFLRDLITLGGAPFRNAIAVVGINTYPGIWSPTTGDAYQDMVNRLADARAAMTAAGFADTVGLDVMENGYPTVNETEQADKLDAMARAARDNASRFGVVRYVWFDLWDANSASPDRFSHYGVLRTDLSLKPAFDRYRTIVNGASFTTMPPTK